jgi:single-strand DNA-binding protein
MSEINKAIVEGRVGQDPYIGENSTRATFSLANNQSYKNRDGEKVEQTYWVNCVGFRHTASFIEKWIKKGDKVIVEGKISSRSYEDKDGNKKHTTEIIIENLSKQNWEKSNNNSGNNDASNAPVSSDQTDDLPF